MPRIGAIHAASVADRRAGVWPQRRIAVGESSGFRHIVDVLEIANAAAAQPSSRGVFDRLREKTVRCAVWETIRSSREAIGRGRCRAHRG
jgi:hypothetical protein